MGWLRVMDSKYLVEPVEPRIAAYSTRPRHSKRDGQMRLAEVRDELLRGWLIYHPLGRHVLVPLLRLVHIVASLDHRSNLQVSTVPKSKHQQCNCDDEDVSSTESDHSSPWPSSNLVELH